ncbi:MAG: hypothetical protein ACRDJP_16880, partial [Actinomycetota bacterium]
VLMYWIASLASDLNLGIRHLIPTFPFVFVLIARSITRLLSGSASSSPSRVLRIAVGTLLAWSVGVALFAWPFYLASFNELARLRPGGARTWVVDSNLDWGQDLKRLARFVRERRIEHISVDYFGTALVEYHIRTAQVTPWADEHGLPEGWFAVSVHNLQLGCVSEPLPGVGSAAYCPIRDEEPVATIGGSIDVYHLGSPAA